MKQVPLPGVVLSHDYSKELPPPIVAYEARNTRKRERARAARARAGADKKTHEKTAKKKPSSPVSSASVGNTPKQCAAYLRVSSASQDLAMQRHAIERAATARGEVIARWYEEKMSGAKLDRPELAKLRADVRAGHVAKLYVYRLDRLTRSGIRDTLEIVQELRHHGCELSTLADGFDFVGPVAEIGISFLAWAAQMERRAIGERISAAKARIEAHGGAWGRPRRVDEELGQKMSAARDAGKSVRAIAAAFKTPKSIVERVLSRKGAYKLGAATVPKARKTK